MKIREIMTGDVRTVTAGTRIVEAAEIMRDRDTGALPVCEGDRPIGMVTDRDITVRVVADGRDVNQCTVRDAMTDTVLQCHRDDDVEKAAELMRSHQVRRILVMGDQGRIQGIVSLGDIAESMDRHQSGEVLRDVSRKVA
jgi:CBS domain-containing protein